MKKSLGVAFFLSIIMLAGCSNEKKDQTEEAAKVMETTKPNVVRVEDFTVENGENTIFGRVYYPPEEGNYPAVILSHGYNGSNNDFAGECKYFAQNGYVAYAYDFCGGSVGAKSTGKSTDMTIFTEKSDLLAVYNSISALDEVDESAVFLFGGSQGGLVTALATEELSDKVKGMILYYPALCIADNWRENFKSVDEIPETKDFWGLTLGKNFFISIRDLYVMDEIGSFANPVLIIHGDKDAIVPIDYSVQAQKLYANAELITLPGEGHGFSPTGAETAKNDVLDFMNQVMGK